MFAWIGLALLSVSWLLGLGYYHGAQWGAWAITIVAGTALLGTRYVRIASRLVVRASFVAGTALLGTRHVRMPGWKALLAALAMIVPAVWLMPWPYRAAPGLLAVGAALALVAAGSVPLGRWLEAAAGACLLAGCLLLSQSLAMFAYAVATSRGHALPAPLPHLVAAAVRALGIEASVHDATIAVFSMRKNHLFSATWELLLDPPTWCFLIGGIVLLWWKARADLPPPGQVRPWRVPALKFALLVALWLPFRAALLIAVYLDNVLRVDYDTPLDAMKLFWNSWVLLAMLVGPVLLAWRFARGATVEQAVGVTPGPWRWRHPLSVALAAASAALIGVGLFWEPAGTRKDGRVLIEEYHPGKDDVWERTDKRFDTKWYGNMSGYNYYCIFDYCGHYYDISRLTKPVDDAALEACDVLILKIPTRPYAPEEIDSITRFVQRGGGLMMIGEHTDVFGSGTYLNSVAEKFDFSYRFDCLFGLDSVFKEHYDRPLAPHPMIQYMPSLDFAISCSIDPGRSNGRAVIRNAGLKNLMADYHADNFYPQPEDSAEMEYGSFIQLWAARYGKGRVAAFTDSTVFSNFCTFEPGKSELMLGMLEWLNHKGGTKHARDWLLAAGAIVLLLGLCTARGWKDAWLLLVAGGLLGWSGAVLGSRELNRRGMPPPPLLRPLVQVVVDRTLCHGPLSDAGFIEGKADGFGIFERWILRLGYFTARRSEDGPAYYQGNAIVLLCPQGPVPRGFRDRLADYVRRGGKVLVVFSPQGARGMAETAPQDATPGAVAGGSRLDAPSAASELLEPFGLGLDVSDPVSGQLDSQGKWPSVPITKAAVVTGGEPFAWVDKKPVAATVAYGDGSVTVVGFGNRFTDPNMGVTGDVLPDEGLEAVYAMQFSLLRAIIDDRPVVRTP